MTGDVAAALAERDALRERITRTVACAVPAGADSCVCGAVACFEKGRHVPFDYPTRTACLRCDKTLTNVDELRGPCDG
jgi:hypothetical protein